MPAGALIAIVVVDVDMSSAMKLVGEGVPIMAELDGMAR